MGEHKIDVPPFLRHAVFLDRDGVLNKAVVRNGKPYPPASVEEFELLPEVQAACADLKQAGFQLVVVTNQPDVGRGTQTRDAVEAMHAVMCEELPIDLIEVCYEAGGTPSTMRKPAPGMILAASRQLGIDLSRSYMVGDRWRDIDAGVAAGCAATFFLDHGYDEKLRTPPDYTVDSLKQAASLIIKLHKADQLPCTILK